MLLPLSYECLCWIHRELETIVHLYNFWFDSIFIFYNVVKTSLLQQVLVAQCLGQQTAFAKVAGSNLSQIFHVTPRCLFVQYSVYPLYIYNGLWLSGLTLPFSSPELLTHAVGCRFESCHMLLFFYLYSVSTKKKFSHSLYLSSWLHSCHTMVKSAVLPKTTILCTSITVITLCSL